MKTIDAKQCTAIALGRLGENEYTVVRFDVSAWLSEYPEAVIGLYNQRPGDTEAYPVAGITVNGGIATWTVTSAELTQTGEGKCELVAIAGEVVAKSAIFRTIVFDALDGSGETPEPWEDWREVFVELKDEAEQAAQTAVNAAQTAESASEAIQNLSVSSTTLTPGSAATVEKTVDPETGAVSLAFGIPEGEQGEKGGIGETPNISIGTVTTLPAGSDATASMTGTPENPVLNLGIPEGQKGEDADISNLAPIIINSASGDIANFADGAEDMPVKQLTVNVEPVQDLHGYDYPWPAGGGENLLPAGEAGTFTNNGMTVVSDGKGNYRFYGTSTASSAVIIAIDEVTLPDTVFLHMLNNSASGQCALVLAYGETQHYAPSMGIVNRIVDVSSGAGGKTINNLRFYINNGYTVDITLSPMLCVDDTVRSYSPFSNICPITGWDGVKVSRTGKNLWNKDDQTAKNGYYNLDGSFSPYSAWRAIAFNCQQGFTYTKSGDGWGGIVTYWYDDTFVSSTNSSTVTVPSGVNNVRFACQYSSTNAQLELGSTATEYEPYQGETYDITLPTEAGTVYGGTLDVSTGELVVDRAMHVFTGNELQYVTVSGGRIAVNIKRYTKVGQAVCSDFSGVATANNLRYIYIPTSMTADELKSYMGEHTVQCVYLIAEPITYTLTPTEIRTFLGQNNIWADTGDVTVKYNADTKLYIDNKITQAIAAAMNS